MYDVALARPGRSRAAGARRRAALVAAGVAAGHGRSGGTATAAPACSVAPPPAASTAARACRRPSSRSPSEVICHRDPRALRSALPAALAARAWRAPAARRSPPTRWCTGSRGMAKAVRRDLHKMHAFVRFRRGRGRRRRALRRLVRARAPHPRRAAPFFVGRFAAHALVDPDARRRRCIGTARRSPSAPACRAREAPAEDALEDWWRTYYARSSTRRALNPRS